MSRRLAPTLAALALTLAAAPAATQDDARAELEGTWTLALSRSQAQARRDAAVDRVVAAMPFFTRSIARSRLQEGSPIDGRITLDFDGSRLEVRFGRRATYTSRLGRTERARRADGTAIRVTQRFADDGRLEQVFQSDGGTRWFTYRPTSAGLDLEITTNSERLPQPMRYTLRYRR